ncbi:LysR family transcriptional regulator [Shewanella xiamenensis]|uniref:LysR family transcriptional regulator n=1 Tax=Shewanella xiamenensis TaxID=332186 RepID=UPI00217A6725|nr:LysR family transcriptional regulator [Shewanella xiamenensis]BDQ66674.1 LysR family transcriptional regulator [Shewanella xiamenensis]GLD79107.1 LysR family transcriptional regulator [Shewanella xiamenensis]
MDPTLLPALMWFVRIAQIKSFTKVAKEYGVTRAALSQNLKTLEQKLGVLLLFRTTRDMSLTEEGQLLFDSVFPALEDIDRALRNVGQAHDEPSGLLRVNTSRVAAKYLLEPHMPEFLALYPELKIELVMDDGLANIIAEGCDAGIRLGESLTEHVVAIPITPMLEMAVVASPAYFEKYGKPTTPSELSGHNCLGFRNSSSHSLYHWEFTSPNADGRRIDFHPNGRLITNDDEGMIRAALNDLGLIQHIDFAIKSHVEKGDLVRVLDDWCPPFSGFFLYVPSRENMSAKTRVFIDFLKEKKTQRKK